jgi:hypothetical protein
MSRAALKSFRGTISLLALALVALLFWAVPAKADYEQVPEHFGVGGEDPKLFANSLGMAGEDPELLANSLGMAINVSGTGLPPGEEGSFYVVGENSRVVRFSAGAEGEPPVFREAWGWGVGDGGSEYQRCGPALITEPTQHTFHICTPVIPQAPFGGEEPGHFNCLISVAVNQATGDVYVLNVSVENRKQHHLVEVFTANGVPLGAGFGDFGRFLPTRESIAEGPGNMHEQFAHTTMSIAVDDAGKVYLTDSDFSGVPNPQSRIMSFEPQTPGDFEHYVYSGQADDIVTSSAQPFRRIALAGSDRLVTGSPSAIREYSLGGGSTPICSLAVSGQLQALTANAVTGEVFYVNFADHKVHRLGSCDQATGEFKELQTALTPEPATNHIYALAVNPGRAWSLLRPGGTLYAADPDLHGTQRGIGDIFVPAERSSPEVKSESVANTTATSSTLRARIDPRGFTTKFHFEYLTASEYLANGESFEGPNAPKLAPATDGQIPAGAVGTASASISGLVQDTEYRFRVIASSECEGLGQPPCQALPGAGTVFRTYPAALPALPDGRAYELVSPVQKNGGEAFPADPRRGSCPEAECKPPGRGVTVVFPMQSAPDGGAVSYMGYAFAPSEGAAVFNSYISKRTVSGWQTTAMSPSLLATKDGENLAYDEGLEEGLIYQGKPQLAPSAPVGYANLYRLRTSASTALSPVLASAPQNRTPGSLELKYAGHSADFSAQLFAANDALTGATPFAPQPPDPTFSGRDLYEWRDGQFTLVNVLPGNTSVATNATFASASPDAHGISIDGSRVYWSSGSTLYVREDGEFTVEVHHAGSFLTASGDGSQVLLSDGCLYSLITEACTDLTEGQGGFQGIAGTGEEGGQISHVYFVDTSALPGAGQNERGEEAGAGKPNLYSWSESGLSFVATLLPDDNVGGITRLGDWQAAPSARTAEASPGGRFLAFGSFAELTGHDNVGPCVEAGSGGIPGAIIDGPCSEVFLYDSATGRLSCPSCNPTGEPPLGNSSLVRIPEEPSWQPQPRYLSDSGRLFFDSSDRLSPLDTNGRVEDVYEFEPQGVGSCNRADGCVTLISPGSGGVDSNFLAADASGANVFFTSRERLVLKDSDELIDVYDARIGGGFAAETETQRTECQGESCQPSPNSPMALTPASSLFHGAGNVKPSTAQKCPKGKVRKSGKCVKQKTKKQRKHARKRPANYNRGGAK